MGVGALLEGVERSVVDRAEQVALQRAVVAQVVAAEPHAHEDVLHDILRPVVPDEQTGIIDERRPVDAVKFVESAAVAGFHPCYQCRIFHFGSG